MLPISFAFGAVAALLILGTQCQTADGLGGGPGRSTCCLFTWSTRVGGDSQLALRRRRNSPRAASAAHDTNIVPGSGVTISPVNTPPVWIDVFSTRSSRTLFPARNPEDNVRRGLRASKPVWFPLSLITPWPYRNWLLIKVNAVHLTCAKASEDRVDSQFSQKGSCRLLVRSAGQNRCVWLGNVRGDTARRIGLPFATTRVPSRRLRPRPASRGGLD
jgi:hypothetical protein